MPDCFGTWEAQTSKSTDHVSFDKLYKIPVPKTFSSLPSGTRAGPLRELQGVQNLDLVLYFFSGIPDSLKEITKENDQDNPN